MMIDKQCDCIFCNCKCPECGSTMVDVLFKPTYVLRRGYEDDSELRFQVQETEVKIECDVCDAMPESSHSDKLSHMVNYLGEQIGLPETVTIKKNEDGSIDIEHYSAKPSKEPFCNVIK